MDFQQSLTLFANWEGFFDRESGILFYQYAFNETCMTPGYFNLKDENETVSQEFSYDVSNVIRLVSC